MSERRQKLRYGRWLPVTIDGLETGLAVTHNASETGALLVARVALDLDRVVSLHFRLPPDGRDEITLNARVVRVGPNERDPNGLWPFSIAVAFEEASPKLDRLLASMASLDEVEGAASERTPPQSAGKPT